MRFKFTKAVVALVTVVALSAVGVAQASAHEFNATVEGTLEGKALNSMVFRKSTSGTWTCTKAAISGKVVKGSQKTVKETVKYSGCTYFGFLMTVSPAEYEFSAEGTVSLLNKFTMEIPILGCHMTLEPATGLKSVSYKNLTGGKLESKLALEGLKYTGTGGECGTGGTITATGNLESTLPSGTLEWK